MSNVSMLVEEIMKLGIKNTESSDWVLELQEKFIEIREEEPALFVKVRDVFVFLVELSLLQVEMEPYFRESQIKLCSKAFTSFKVRESEDQSIIAYVDCIKEEVVKDERPHLYTGLVMFADDFLRRLPTNVLEVRGAEAADMLNRVKTNHSLITTLHAEDAMNIPSRLLNKIELDLYGAKGSSHERNIHVSK